MVCELHLESHIFLVAPENNDGEKTSDKRVNLFFVELDLLLRKALSNYH